MNEHPKLILASGSPRRRDILRELGVPYEVVPSDVDEDAPELRAMPPAEQARTLARRKAEAVAGQVDPGRLVLGADTVVAVDQDVLGKPRDAAEAAAMLRRLSDRWHVVITAVALVRRQPALRWEAEERTEVRFRALADGEIAAYVATGEPMDKAGAYGIQGLGGSLVAEVRGSYNNVVGLPDQLGGEALAELIGGHLGQGAA